MVYPSNFEEKIGFQHIRTQLEQFCLSAPGRAYVDKMRFSADFVHIERRLKQLEEFRQIMLSDEDFPLQYFIDPHLFLKKVGLEGAFLTEEEFGQLIPAMDSIFGMLRFFDKHELIYPQLSALRKMVDIEEAPFKEIRRSFDLKWHITDNASPELRKLRTAIKSAEQRARKAVESVFREAKEKGYVPEGQSITIRDGRLVVPLAAEHKRRIKGYVQDESATGQMLYIEPAESLELNNELRELQYEERREVVRILIALTSVIRPSLKGIEAAFRFMALIDFIQAKARFALKINACMPQLQKNPQIKWTGAYNVVLLLNQRVQQKEIVPLNIHLDNKQRMLIISGPNAGGKSVALKTIGLLQYMCQCGLLVPVQADSSFGVFQQILIDIGDEQSIENDLSTYSSHLLNMREFINRANRKTLLLIDEFGTGTEPQIGAAMAESILDELYGFGSFGVITTHYDNIKHYAEQHSEVVNGAMRFDQERLQPLYQLEMGKPGSSFALELAQKMGIPGQVIDNAKKRAGTEKIDYELLLASLEYDKQSIAKGKKAIVKKEEELKQLADEYVHLKSFLEDQKRQIIKEAKEEAKRLIFDANKTVENTIRQIKEAQADKEKTKAARQQLTHLREKISRSDETVSSSKLRKLKGEQIKLGDSVLLDDSEAIGEVLALKGKEAQISLGGLTSFVRLDRLTKVSKSSQRKQERQNHSLKGQVNMNEKMAGFSMDIDVRGQRAEEAITEVDRFLDSALMLGQQRLRILHGKGNGILREVIRNYIKQYDFVKSFENEHVERGGDGITVVYLK